MATPGGPPLIQRLVDEHYVTLYRYAFRLCGSAADAEDLTQEAFCKAQTNLGQLRNQSALNPGCSVSCATPICTGFCAERQEKCVALESLDELPERAAPSCPTSTPNNCSSL